MWYTASPQAPQLLADGEVIMTSVFNGRIHNAIVNEGADFKIVWHGQIWAPGAWVLPKGSPNAELAHEWVKFATSPESQARMGNLYPYGPTRRSAQALVDPKLAMNLPTSPQNFKHALRRNDIFWAEHIDELNERFAAWLAK